MKTCAVIYNPISGKKIKFKVMPQFEKILASYGYETKIIYTKYKGHATEIVRDLENDSFTSMEIVNFLNLMVVTGQEENQPQTNQDN